jgi:hypothetical protein
MTEHDLSAIFRRAQAEIRADVLAGHVPADVPDFAALHDYTDANVYGHAWLVEILPDGFLTDLTTALSAAIEDRRVYIHPDYVGA